MHDVVLRQTLQFGFFCDSPATDEPEDAEQFVLPIAESQEVIEAEQLVELALKASLVGSVYQLVCFGPAKLVSALCSVCILWSVDQFAPRFLVWTAST